VMAAIVAGGYALMGAVLTHWLPEPAHEVESDGEAAPVRPPQ
jgi:hypothetical protein